MRAVPSSAAASSSSTGCAVGGASGTRRATSRPASGASAANAHTAEYPPSAYMPSPMTEPNVRPPQIDRPNIPIVCPRRSSGARSTIQVTPAVKTQPSPRPTTSRAKIRPATPNGRNSSSPASEQIARPVAWIVLRPCRSASRPPIGRPISAEIANAPTTTPTATFPAPSSSVT